MAIRELVDERDPVLFNETEKFDFDNPPMDPEQLALDLIETMNHHEGYGLSANQIGLPYSVFVMKGAGINYVCFNPRIVSSSDEEILLEEGCLSFPHLFIKIKRPRHVRLRFFTANGHVETKQYTGMTARVVQHELDHLDGVTFLNRATKFHKDQGINKRKKLIRRLQKKKTIVV